MISIIKQKINNVEYKRILSNFLSLSVLQGLNYILPLITLPYLIQTLGVDKFGLVSFAAAFVIYFNVISDYGFHLTATRDISKNREESDVVNKIASAVFTCKAILLFVCFLILCFIVSLFPTFKDDPNIYFISFGVVSAQAFFPVWFFQGIEAMKYITYVNLISKSVFTFAIFIFINNEADYYMVPMFTAIGFLIASIISIYLMYYKYKFRFILPTVNELKLAIKNGFHIFLANAFTSLYTNSNVVLLGIVANPTTVGYYSIAEKIVGAFSGLFIPLNQALYPFLAKKYHDNKIAFLSVVKKMQMLMLLTGISLSLVVFIFRELIVGLVANEVNSIVILLTAILCLRIISSPFANLLSNLLVIMNATKEYLKVMKITVAVNVLIVFPMIIKFGVIGLAPSYIFVLWIHVLLLGYYVRISKGELIND